MKTYKTSINMEWTSKCNARCIMCPQSEIRHPMLMRPQVFDKTLQRIAEANIFRVVIAGYGEPTTHPHFMPFIDKIRAQPVRFDMVSNGQLLDSNKIRHLDGVIHTLTVSFSSINPAVYRAVHVNLDQEQVKQNIVQAQQILNKTQLAISLTPLSQCLDSLEETILWFRQQGINNLSMSPTLYNRAGNLNDQQIATERLRQIIKAHHLHSQELDFVPALSDIARHCLHNRFRCIPRNVDLFIASNGDYLYCYNDISHQHAIGNIAASSIDEVLTKRERMAGLPALCDSCNMKNRYGLFEAIKVAYQFRKDRLLSS